MGVSLSRASLVCSWGASYSGVEGPRVRESVFLRRRPKGGRIRVPDRFRLCEALEQGIAVGDVRNAHQVQVCGHSSQCHLQQVMAFALVDTGINPLQIQLSIVWLKL